jgi:predicted DCC family thiol-disulfide oxidoreductase YuxK
MDHGWHGNANDTPERVVYFDGVCGLCNGLVDFLIRHDRRRRLRFAALQSRFASRHLGASPQSGAPNHGSDIDLSTVIFVDDGRRYLRSTAALRAIAELGGAFSGLRVLLLIPRPLRDAVYDIVARNRYRLFGRRDVCRIPTAQDREWILD